MDRTILRFSGHHRLISGHSHIICLRIKTDGQYDWRNEQYEQAAQQLGEATKSKGIDAATAFTIKMLGNLERGMEHEDMTEELAEILSTETVWLT